jgi:hypothetical protein
MLQLDTPGDLNKPGCKILSYTGIVCYLTLGWKRRYYSGRGLCIAAKRPDGSFRWIRRKVIKKIKHARRINNTKPYEWKEYWVWQITP